MVIMLKKKGNMSKYDIIQLIFKCCVSQMYLIVLLPKLKRMYDQIDRIENKLDLFIANWSYSYNKKIVFGTYQRMRAKGASWAGTSIYLFYLISYYFTFIYNSLWSKKLEKFTNIFNPKYQPHKIKAPVLSSSDSSTSSTI